MGTSMTAIRSAWPALLVLAALTVAGCSSPGAPQDPAPGSADQLVGKAETNKEYSDVVAELEWPPDVAPPERSDDLEGASYQVGVGATDAVMAWNCAWGRAWLEARESDPAAAEHALAVYASIVDRPEFQQYFDPQSAQPVVRGIIEDAQLGDPSGVQRDVAANCPVTES